MSLKFPGVMLLKSLHQFDQIGNLNINNIMKYLKKKKLLRYA